MVRKSARPRRHTAAFKWEAVQLLQRRAAAGVSMQRVADELEVDLSSLRTWANAVAGAPAGTPAAEIFPGSGHPRAFPARPAAALAAAPPTEAPEAELRRLRRENERLRQERDFLKKAAAFFAKESR